jgi:hypothetical protein
LGINALEEKGAEKAHPREIEIIKAIVAALIVSFHYAREGASANQL